MQSLSLGGLSLVLTAGSYSKLVFGKGLEDKSVDIGTAVFDNFVVVP